MKLLPQDFDGSVFPSVNDYVAGKIKGYAFEHRTATTEEHDKAVLDMIRSVYYDDLQVAGEHRHQIWENGWMENLAKFDPAHAGLELAKPRYHDKYPIVRWKGDLYVPLSPGYEYNMLSVIGDWVFDRYLRKATRIFEFGCGTGHNMFRMRDVNPDASLIGLDWAESAVKFINLQAKAGAYGDPTRIWAERFDYFNPNPSLYVPPGSGFVTVASLEQTGRKWHKWMEWALNAKPEICVHIEPIEEVLMPDVLLDHLSLEYFTKRGYLAGFLHHLTTGSYCHNVEVVEVVRTRIGSKFIEGYTVVVWRPRP